MPTATTQSEDPAALYLNLLKGCLTRGLFPESRSAIRPAPSRQHRPIAWTVHAAIARLLRRFGFERRGAAAPALTGGLPDDGNHWPLYAETMIGDLRLDNLQTCVADVLQSGIPGDFVETGVWRGGACIFMRAMLKAYGIRDRTVWVADSFAGLPKPDGRYAQDAGSDFWRHKDVLGVSLAQVQANFARYGLLDDRVAFLQGWFKDTLPTAPIAQIAVLRLDGDMYASTMDALRALYPKLSPGGYVIIDDYGAVPVCRQAVEDYRREHTITEPIQPIDWTGVFWQRTGSAAPVRA